MSATLRPSLGGIGCRAALGLALALCLGAQDTPCTLDLSVPGKLSDIVSNALMRGCGQEGARVEAFLDGSGERYGTGGELLAAAAKHFDLKEAGLRKQVMAFQHVNCKHGPMGGEDNGVRDHWQGGEEDIGEILEVSPFARDVILHVVLHEIGHALVREFDLPILGNEETLADAFATHFLTTYLPERAGAVLLARVQSLVLEARKVPPQAWTVAGEHNSDARRAFQIAALCVAADRNKYTAVARAAGMSDGEVSSASDYGGEIHRSWRRILAPLRMPAGQLSSEARLDYEETPLFASLLGAGLGGELLSVLRSFDWHSQVRIDFRTGEGSASWSRARRTITVNSEYVQRFVAQGRRLEHERGTGR